MIDDCTMHSVWMPMAVLVLSHSTNKPLNGCYSTATITIIFNINNNLHMNRNKYGCWNGKRSAQSLFSIQRCSLPFRRSVGLDTFYYDSIIMRRENYEFGACVWMNTAYRLCSLECILDWANTQCEYSSLIYIRHLIYDCVEDLLLWISIHLHR